MRLSIRLFAGLRERAGCEHFVLEGLPEPLDVARLKGELARRHPELGPLEHVRGVVGTRWVPDAHLLQPDDEVGLLPPVSGGMAGGADAEGDLEAGVFEIHAEALVPGEALARVGHPSCGANVVFTGTTRDSNRARRVVLLDYEAFAAMAFDEMERIFRDCLARFGPPAAERAGAAPDARRLRMLVLHRTGEVGVGEPSIVVAVASPHRDAGFKAARFLIDELKARVPLWKREVYDDGHQWIGERS